MVRANYVAATPTTATQAEAKQLPRPVPRRQALMGFCRTNLFKRLESSGEAFSNPSTAYFAELHFPHLDNNLPLPWHTGFRLLDDGNYDEDWRMKTPGRS